MRNVRVRPTTPSFAAAYGERFGRGCLPVTEPMLTILPCSARCRYGSAALQARNTPVRLTAIVSFHSSRLTSTRAARRAGDAGVVHEDVEVPSRPCRRELHEPPRGGRGPLRRRRDSLRVPPSAVISLHTASRFARRRPFSDDMRSAPGKPLGDRRADTLASTGHNGGGTVETVAVVELSATLDLRSLRRGCTSSRFTPSGSWR